MSLLGGLKTYLRLLRKTASQAITPMSTLPNPCTRELQLGLFEGDCRTQQDQDLIDTIQANGYTQALAVGDADYFANFIKLVDTGPAEFCIYIQMEEFDFNTLVDHVNHIIKTQMNPGSLLYLSLNKYMAEAKCYDSTLSSDYDIAIGQFITKHVYANVEQYLPCGLDFGNKFNWVHPLTRFWLRVPR